MNKYKLANIGDFKTDAEVLKYLEYQDLVGYELRGVDHHGRMYLKLKTGAYNGIHIPDPTPSVNGPSIRTILG